MNREQEQLKQDFGLRQAIPVDGGAIAMVAVKDCTVTRFEYPPELWAILKATQGSARVTDLLAERGFAEFKTPYGDGTHYVRCCFGCRGGIDAYLAGRRQHWTGSVATIEVKQDTLFGFGDCKTLYVYRELPAGRYCVNWDADQRTLCFCRENEEKGEQRSTTPH